MFMKAFLIGAALAATTLARPATVVQVTQYSIIVDDDAPLLHSPFEHAAEEPVMALAHHGDATYYLQYGVAGSCGKIHAESDHIVAISANYPAAHNAMCGKSLTMTYKGSSVKATVADLCPGCAGKYDLDLSIGAMKALDPNYEVDGRIKIEWHFD